MSVAFVMLCVVCVVWLCGGGECCLVGWFAVGVCVCCVCVCLGGVVSVLLCFVMR